MHKKNRICIRDEMRNVRVDGSEGRFVFGWSLATIAMMGDGGGRVGGALIVFVLQTITHTHTHVRVYEHT